jgi:hypothetical protein
MCQSLRGFRLHWISTGEREAGTVRKLQAVCFGLDYAARPRVISKA